MVTLGDAIAVPGSRRLTSGSETFRCCWAVESTLQAGTEQIDYEVHYNDPTLGDSGIGTALVGRVTVRGIAQPDFSSAQSPQPGAPPGQAPIECYSLQLLASNLPAGTITVEAVATGRDGSIATMRPIVFFNDRDGTDRRPSNRTVHWRPVTGNNANGGTSSSDAVRDLPRAIALASVGGDCGGATIMCHENVVGNGNAGNTAWPVWRTGSAQHPHWLTIEFTGGATWTLHAPPSTNQSTGAGGDVVLCTAPNATDWCRVRLRSYRIGGTGPTFRAENDCRLAVFREGGIAGSVYYDGNGARAATEIDSGASGGKPIDLVQASVLPGQPNNTSPGEIYVVGEQRLGGRIGYNRDSWVFDCVSRGMLGGATYMAGLPYRRLFHTITHTERTHARNVTRGWGANRQEGFLPAEPLTAVDQGGGVTRILGPVAGLPFGEALADNIGLPGGVVQVGVYGWPGLDGVYDILDAGTDGSNRPYVDVTASGTYGAAPGGADLETTLRGLRFNLLIHPSSLSVDDNHHDCILRDICTYNSSNEVQSHFSNSETQTRLLIDNCRDSGGGANWNMGGADYVGCIIRRVSAPGSGIIIDAGASFPGSELSNSVFLQAGADLAGAIGNGLTVRDCHFINGNAGQLWHGTNPSFGAWTAADPTDPPYSMEPATANKGTGTATLQNVADWAWAGTPTRGVTKAVGLVDWSAGATVQPIEVVGNVTVPVTVTGTAALDIRADASVTVPVAVTGTAVLGIAVSGTLVVPVSVVSQASWAIVVPPTPTGEVASLVPPRPGTSMAQQASPSDSGAHVAANALYVGGAGTVSVLLEDGTSVQFVTPAGIWLPVRHVRVNSTGTSSASQVQTF